MNRFVMELEDYKEDIIIANIAAGEKHSLVTSKTGKVFSFGYNQQGQLGQGNIENQCRPKLVEGIIGHNIVQVAAGRNHSLILDSKGDVYASGSDLYGQIGMPDKETVRTNFSHVLSLMSVNVAQIYAGGLHSFVVLDDILPKKDDF